MPGWQSRDDVAIVAATDAFPARRAAFLAACPNGRWYDSAEDLLSGETLDFVDICTPPSSHAALIQQALQSGLHVLCEKPLVIRPADAQLVAMAAVRAGRVVHAEETGGKSARRRLWRSGGREGQSGAPAM